MSFSLRTLGRTKPRRPDKCGGGTRFNRVDTILFRLGSQQVADDWSAGNLARLDWVRLFQKKVFNVERKVM